MSRCFFYKKTVDVIYSTLYKIGIMIRIDPDKIRNRTIKKMEETGLSLNATAKEMGVVQPVLFRFLNGQTTPNIDNLNKIFDYLYGECSNT